MNQFLAGALPVTYPLTLDRLMFIVEECYRTVDKEYLHSEVSLHSTDTELIINSNNHVKWELRIPLDKSKAAREIVARMRMAHRELDDQIRRAAADLNRRLEQDRYRAPQVYRAVNNVFTVPDTAPYLRNDYTFNWYPPQPAAEVRMPAAAGPAVEILGPANDAPGN